MEVNKCLFVTSIFWLGVEIYPSTIASTLHGRLYRVARSNIQSRCMHYRIADIYKINCSNQCFFMRAILIKKGN